MRKTFCDVCDVEIKESLFNVSVCNLRESKYLIRLTDVCPQCYQDITFVIDEVIKRIIGEKI